MAKVQICVGMVASGKSTFAKFRAQEGAIVQNDDSIVNSVHGQNYALYEKDLKPLYKGLGYAVMSLGLSLGRDVVVDRTNLKRSTRRRYISAARCMDAEVEAVVFPMLGPEIHAERRAKSDGRGFGYEKWLEVAQRHMNGFSPVAEDEGFDSIIRFSNDDVLKMVEETK